MGVRACASEPVRWRLSAALAIGLASAAPAAAQEAPTVFGWTLDSVRAGVRYGPDYVGSDDYRAWFTGALVLSRHDALATSYGAPDDGLSLGLLGTGPVTAGLVGRWRSSRDNDNDLSGFEKVDATIEAGAFVNWWAADWLRLRAEARRGFGGHDSWVGDFAADAIVRGERWGFTAGPRLDWGEEAFTRTYFEVTPTDAARSPLGIAAYAPGETYWAPGVVASVEYRVTPRWSLQSVATYSRLTGDAADSPIVEKLGSADQASISLSVRYTLGQ